MAVSLSPTSYLPSKMNSAQPSVSCAGKVYAGLRAQFPDCLRVGKPNSNAEFRSKVAKCIASCKGKPTCGRILMMPIGTPEVAYRNPIDGRWQLLDLWNALYRERIVYIGNYIDEQFSNQILATMLYLDTIDDWKKLVLYVCTPGGDITPSLSIYDTMQCMKSPVGTLCLGFADSMSSFLIIAGEKGNRTALPHSRITLESPAGSSRGQADDILNEATELVRVRDYLFKQLAQKTGQPIDKIYDDLDRVKRFSAQEAIEYGLIDRIVRPERIKPDAPKKY